MSKEIPLSGKCGNGYTIIVDDADYERVSQYKWNLHPGVQTNYAKRSMFFDGKWHTVSVHRFILSAPSDKEVDHINGDGLDNRRCNLRLVDSAQNAMNRPKHQTNEGKYKSVYRIRNGRWAASIGVKGKRIYLGTFATQREAAEAYNRAAIEHFGEFARLNVIDHDDPTDTPVLPTRQPTGPKRSQYRNVVWDNERQTWIARLVRNGKTKFLGRFHDEESAAAAIREYLAGA